MRDCVICGSHFEPKNPRRPALTCSRACRNKLQWQRVPNRKSGPPPAPRPVLVCAFCGKEFVSGAHLGRAIAAMYCSRSCTGRAKARDGMHIATADGRARVHLRDGSRQLYSRCLMEGHLGRDLTYNDVVHHLNGDPADDRIENLVVMSRAAHTRMHSLEWWQTQRGRA